MHPPSRICNPAKCSRQTRQNRLELVDDLSLDSRIVHSRLVIRISWANRNIAVAAPQHNDIGLPWQARATAPARVASAQQSSVDASEDVLELAGVVALGLGYSREVDVKERVRWKVRLATVDNGGGDIKSEISVDLAVERSRSVPGSWVSSLTGESDGWDLSCLCCVRSCPYGSAERNLDADVAANVRSGKCELWLCAIPQLGCDDIDALFDGCNWE
jgi:hypothetical protein